MIGLVSAKDNLQKEAPFFFELTTYPSVISNYDCVFKTETAKFSKIIPVSEKRLFQQKVRLVANTFLTGKLKKLIKDVTMAPIKHL